jgi:Holliday junction DNA helicase RuvA
MIRSLTGTIQTIIPEGMILDVSGVGYEVFLSSGHIFSLVPQQGTEVRISIYTHVKEDALQLFGFVSEAQRELFVQLLSVSGVGPRTALAVLDKGSDQVVSAIQNSDVAFFQGVPRLGKKTAQKIIVDLQSKLGKIQDLALGPVSSTLREVQEALVGMGFAEAHVRDALLDIDPDLDVAQALKTALRKLKKA